jgi:predicted DCC family thiol-disulfide oxidoreductase YuxK
MKRSYEITSWIEDLTNGGVVDVIIYDGDCPFCDDFSKYVELKKNLDRQLILVNARELTSEVLAILKRNKLDVNEGMVGIFSGEIYYGGEIIRYTANLDTLKPSFWYIVEQIVNYLPLWGLSYFVMTLVRRLVLMLLRKKQL